MINQFLCNKVHLWYSLFELKVRRKLENCEVYILFLALLTSYAVFVSQVNSYPTDRGFTAIGIGGDDFVQSMVVAVESVLQESIPKVSFFYSS
jgi:hypothetical protein